VNVPVRNQGVRDECRYGRVIKYMEYSICRHHVVDNYNIYNTL
jgi:hypothetical protein